MVTDEPTVPDVGANEVIAGGTVKLDALVAVCPLTETVIAPLVAPDGTVTVRLVEVALIIVAAVPLNCTVLPEAVVLKFVPVIDTDEPMVKVAGVNDEMPG